MINLIAFFINLIIQFFVRERYFPRVVLSEIARCYKNPGIVCAAQLIIEVSLHYPPCFANFVYSASLKLCIHCNEI
jgi:hypothetical protein